MDGTGAPVWPLSGGGYLLSDVGINYDAISSAHLSRRMGAMLDDDGPPSPGGDDTNTYTPDVSPYTPPDYGTNLYIAQPAVTSGYLTGIGTNTLADVQYEIQSRTNLLQSDWQSEGSIYGSETTNWTSLSVAQNSRTNLFIRLQSYASSDGSGLPDWWELQYFGTNGVDPNGNPAGDGWSNIQKFQNGWNPNLFYTPAAPQGLNVVLNANNIATASWWPSPGPVTGYTASRYYFVTAGNAQTQTFNVSASSVSLQDPTPLIPHALTSAGLKIWASYKVQAHYSGGDSAWSDTVWVNDNEANISFVAAPDGSTLLSASALPPGTAGVRIFKIDQSLEVFNGSSAYDTQYDIPLAGFTNGFFQVPTAWTTPLPDNMGAEDYFWYGEAINTNDGAVSDGEQRLSYGYYLDATRESALPPLYNGQVQLKQNLIFQLCAATASGPLEIQEYASGTAIDSSVTNRANYVFSSYYSFDYLNAWAGSGYYPQVDVIRPFVDNNLYRNLVFSSADADDYGNPTTGVDSSWNVPGGPISLDRPETYQFQIAANNVSPLLATNSTKWLNFMPLSADGNVGENVGLATTDNGDFTSTYTLNSAHNSFGLPILSVNFWGMDADSGNPINQVLYPGNAVTAASFSLGAPVNLYFETVQPQFQTVEYDFWNPNQNALPGSPLPMPAGVNFSLTNTSHQFFTSPGSQIQVVGYAKLAVLNGNPGLVGYLGQYFDKAYKIDNNGNVTTNTTGILSPYGNFFATEPGLTALVTMPDVDTGERGTCTVYTVSAVIDRTQASNMDLSFNGANATSSANPAQIWANNNYDRFTLDADDQIEYDDDVQIGGDYYTQNTPVPDYNFKDGAGHRAISCARDLQDFFRLWVCGIDTNLIAKLPAGSTITLNWGDVGSPNTGNPTIDIFAAADPDGGIGYLTNSLTAEIQTDPVICPYIGRLGPGQSIQLNAIQFANGWAGNHFIMCGVSNGTGGLNLTIADASGNVLAQSTSYLQIVDIKQMYERWTIGDMPSIALKTNAVPATEDLSIGASAFQYTQPQDTNTSYILFVHGWNMERWEKDRFAESAFKRLYWQGYHGRFGVFRWPTENGFKGISSLATDPSEKDNFDRSEYTAWQSSVGLLNKLKDLNAEYPGHVYMLAHSMGNIVAGEALRLATQQGLGHLVNTYVASQAAVSAHTYDTNIANYSFNYFPWRSQAVTPNIYGNWFLGNNGGGAGQVVNFYNTNDYALQRSVWQLNQLLKPDQFVLLGGTHWDYSYVGVTNDPPPWNHFQKDASLQIWNEVNFDIVNVLTNRYEVMGLAAESYTTALGATPGVHNVADSIYLGRSTSRIWPVDTTGNNYAAHFWHSAEFRGDYWQQQGYWSELLGSDAFNLK